MDKPFAVDKQAMHNNGKHSVPSSVCHVHVHDMTLAKQEGNERI